MNREELKEFDWHEHGCIWCGRRFPCTLEHPNGMRPRDKCSECGSRDFRELWEEYYEGSRGRE